MIVETKQLKAINPKTNELVNVTKFIKDVGINYREQGILPICPACKQTMKVYGYTSIDLTARFMHISDSVYCPLTTSRSSLSNADYDESRSERFRASFFDRDAITKTYVVAHSLCSRRLSIAEFHLMIVCADARNLWALEALTIEILPYLLVLLIDFEKDDKDFSSKTKRAYSYRFVLHKPKGRKLNSLSTDQRNCYLTKVNTVGEHKGKTICNPVTKEIVKLSIFDEKYESVRNNHDWISPSFIDKLLDFRG